ncbi:MAG TPA: hypothetical protein VGK31_00425 [Thermoanaerobaculia bacterium]|jgi:hypothetical protein
MRFLRKLIAFALYAAVLLPGSDYRLNAWMKAVEVTSTALDRTLRRRKSSIENDRFARFVKLMHDLDGDHDFTWRRRN